MKRAFDLSLTLLTAPLWGTALALAALATLACMGRPVFFRQERAGRGGRAFYILKLRSMRQGEGDDASRLTPFGRFLRASSLDELPELLNVLKGEMSLVGPRPLPIRYLPRYSEEQRRRHDVLPGITGWAQVNGRNLLSWREKFRLDLEYVDRRSAAFDLYILFLTVRKVLFPGAEISHAGEATMPEFTGEN